MIHVGKNVEHKESNVIVAASEGLIVRGSPSLDAAAELALEADQIEGDPKLENRVRMKADIFVCVICCCVYCLMYMDKVSNSDASIMGLKPALNMKGSDYSWVGSAFYFGYLGFQVFGGNILIQHLPIGLTTGVFIVLWGMIVACLGAVDTYSSFVGLRVLQGMFEGCVTPSFVLITSQWYQRTEHNSRIQAWYSSIGIGEILVDALAYGLYTRKSSPMAPWRLVFIILGCATVGVGLIYICFIPPNPRGAWWLSYREKLAAVNRIRDNKQGFGTHTTKLYQIKEAFVDVRTYLYFAIVVLLNVPNGGITNYNAIIINNMGYSISDSLLMDMPSGATQLVVQLGLTFITPHLFPTRRMYYAIFFAAYNILALCLLAFGSNKASLAGYYQWAYTSPVVYGIVLSNVASNSAGYTKKVVVSSVVGIAYSVGNLIGPQTFKNSETPRYQTAKNTMVGCSCAVLVLIIVLFLIDIFENRGRDQKNQKLPATIIDPEFADLTDFENPEFRYAL